MGKYATYRLRGGGTPLTAPIGPPPAPTLGNIMDELVSLSGSVSNVGGTVTLQVSVDGDPPWDLADTSGWEANHSWGEIPTLPDGFYRAFESGNGTDYAGDSDKSDIYEVAN